MRWALKRQFLYALSVFVVIALLIAGGWFVFFYHPATCSDGIQNQDEMGIDCGGVCKKLCTAPRVSALWARAVLVAPGVYHAVAMVQNPETDAGTEHLPYTFSLYDDNNILVAERSGIMYLRPGEIAPLFEANIITSNRVPAHTFVQFGQAVWSKMDRAENPIAIVSQSLDSEALKLTAHMQNKTVYPLARTTITALLYDAEGTLVNASQTVLSNIPARGEKDIAFTWQQPFAKPVARFEITPRVQ